MKMDRGVTPLQRIFDGNIVKFRSVDHVTNHVVKILLQLK